MFRRTAAAAGSVIVLGAVLLPAVPAYGAIACAAELLGR